MAPVEGLLLCPRSSGTYSLAGKSRGILCPGVVHSWPRGARARVGSRSACSSLSATCKNGTGPVLGARSMSGKGTGGGTRRDDAGVLGCLPSKRVDDTGKAICRATRDKRGQLMELEKDGAQESDKGMTLEDVDVGSFSDVELQGVVKDIAMIEQQSDVVARQMMEHARLLADASKKLRARAQGTRLEAAKVKKMVTLQQAEELRRREELRLSRLRVEEDARRQQQQHQEQVRLLQQQIQHLIENQKVLKLQQEEDLREMQVQQELKAATSQSSDEEVREKRELNTDAPTAELPTEPNLTASVQSRSVALPDAGNGAAVAALGAAVLPFSFPNGKHSGKEIDSALTCGPSLEGCEPASGSLVAYTEPTLVDGPAGPSPDDPPSSLDGVSSHLELITHENDSDWVVTEDLECEIAHPGAMACTKAVVRKNPANRVAVVSVETTVRCNGDGCYVDSLDVEDFAALAVSTLLEEANKMKHSNRFQVAPMDADPRISQRRKDIVELLRDGRVVSCKAMEPPSKFGHESFIIDLRKQGKQIRAMFKPRVDGDAEGWHRAPVEWIAYELNLLLGMDYVPPVAYRTGGVDLGNGLKYKEGAFIYWVPSAKELQLVPAAIWGVSVARLLSDTRVLDILLNNSDRHHGHFLYGEHWTDGRKGVVLIDHAAGFRKEATVHMEHDNAFQTGEVKCVSAHTYLRLRFLDRAMVEEKFGEMLSPGEISGLMERKNQVLAYLDGLVQERGYHRTVVD